MFAIKINEWRIWSNRQIIQETLIYPLLSQESLIMPSTLSSAWLHVHTSELRNSRFLMTSHSLLRGIHYSPRDLTNIRHVYILYLCYLSKMWERKKEVSSHHKIPRVRSFPRGDKKAGPRPHSETPEAEGSILPAYPRNTHTWSIFSINMMFSTVAPFFNMVHPFFYQTPL